MNAPPRSVISSAMCACAMVGGSCRGEVVSTLSATEDTFITEHEEFGGPTSVHGDQPFLAAIGRNFTPFRSFTLVKFDLSGHVGQWVAGDATFRIQVGDAVELEETRTVSVHHVLTDWTEGTLSWDGFGAEPGLQPETDIWEPPHDTVFLTPSDGDLPVVLEFRLPAALIQEWIDDPASNHGLLLAVGGLGRDIYFTSTEAEEGAVKPSLEFPSLPRPSSLTLLSSEIDIGSGAATFTWSSTGGTSYRIMASEDLLIWNPLEEGVEATGSVTNRTVAFQPSSRMFFRIEEETE